MLCLSWRPAPALSASRYIHQVFFHILCLLLLPSSLFIPRGQKAKSTVVMKAQCLKYSFLSLLNSRKLKRFQLPERRSACRISSVYIEVHVRPPFLNSHGAPRTSHTPSSLLCSSNPYPSCGFRSNISTVPHLSESPTSTSRVAMKFTIAGETNPRGPWRHGQIRGHRQGTSSEAFVLLYLF